MGTLTLPPDPSLKDLQLAFESQYWGKRSFFHTSYIYEEWLRFFGEDRKPRDLFRSDVADYREWCRKRGNADSSINTKIHLGARFYRFLDALELIEKDFNPFKDMAPRRIRLK
jgi:hypothetical protein